MGELCSCGWDIKIHLLVLQYRNVIRAAGMCGLARHPGRVVININMLGSAAAGVETIQDMPQMALRHDAEQGCSRLSKGIQVRTACADAPDQTS